MKNGVRCSRSNCLPLRSRTRDKSPVSPLAKPIQGQVSESSLGSQARLGATAHCSRHVSLNPSTTTVCSSRTNALGYSATRTGFACCPNAVNTAKIARLIVLISLGPPHRNLDLSRENFARRSARRPPQSKHKAHDFIFGVYTGGTRARIDQMSPTSLMTFAEFERLPEIEGKRELLEGEITITPPPELAHSRIARQILFLFWARLDKSRVWPDHTGYRIAQGWIEPDVSVSWPDQRRDEKYFLGSPMIAVEILSPGEEIDRKLTLYFAEGAFEVWVIHAKRKAMTVYSNQNDQVIRLVVDREYRSEAAQATFSVTEIFE